MSEAFGVVVFGRTLTLEALLESVAAVELGQTLPLLDGVGPLPRQAWAITAEGSGGNSDTPEDAGLEALSLELSRRCGRACFWSYQSDHEVGQRLVLHEEGRLVLDDHHHPEGAELAYDEWPLSRLARAVGLEEPEDEDVEFGVELDAEVSIPAEDETPEATAEAVAEAKAEFDALRGELPELAADWELLAAE